jgi:hypothetical protein
VTGSLIPQPRELVVEECADRVITEPQNSLNEGVATFKEASLDDGIEGDIEVEEDINQGETLVSSTILNV